MTSIGNTARRRNLNRAFSYLGLMLALVVPSFVVAQIGTEFASNESFATGETLSADKLNRLVTTLRNASGAPGLGSVVAHMPNVTGAATIAQMNQRGWAVCDGTSTAEVTGAVIATTPDLQGQFLRGIGGMGPATAGTAQADATAKNGLSFLHQHATRVTDNAGTCNGPASSFPGVSSARLTGPNTLWDYNAATSTAAGCAYLSGPPTTTGADAPDIGAGDAETRPANIGVVWMMRVR